MKKSSRRRPEVESLETLTLLSTIAVGVRSIIPTPTSSSVEVSAKTGVDAIGHSSPTSVTAIQASQLGVAPATPRIANGNAGTSTIASTSAHRLIAMGSASSPTIASTSAHRLIAMGSASTPMIASTSAHRLIVIGSTNGDENSPIVHSMIIPASREILLGSGSASASTTTATQSVKAPSVVAIGEASTSLKSS